MAKYMIVTPAFAQVGYALESEGLAGLDVEIVEAPMDEAGFRPPEHLRFTRRNRRWHRG